VTAAPTFRDRLPPVMNGYERQRLRDEANESTVDCSFTPEGTTNFRAVMIACTKRFTDCCQFASPS
jgi:hypothetical protein